MKKAVKTVFDLLRDPETWRYVLVGLATTAVSYAIYPLCYEGLFGSEAPGALGETAAQVLSILFAYLPNKLFVFRSRRATKRGVIGEFFAFFGTRIGTFLASILLVFLLTDLIGLPGWIGKLVTVVVCFIGNYLFSKLLVFVKHNKESKSHE